MNSGKSLKDLRTRLGITVREVEDESQKIASAQCNPEFLVSNNWLTRLENSDAVPSIHKLFSLSTVYLVWLSDLLPMFGIHMGLLQKYQIQPAPSYMDLVKREQIDVTRAPPVPYRSD